MVTYLYPNGPPLRLHATCDAIWKQELELSGPVLERKQR
jgi:hypothetical protein